MSRKNASFAAGLAAGIDPPEDAAAAPRRPGLGANVLTGRENRLAELAAGTVVSRTHELVDPARCRMWVGHNREYALLTEERCADLIESMKAQGRQEMPAIVRRVRGEADYDFEVICGARRHWSISWLRSHNYPDFRFLVDIRELSDEEAFRLADIENRAREDLTDLERARDYLRALDAYYEGRQKVMAERIKVTESWLSRYLDLARLPNELMAAFPNPQDLRIKHVTAIKPLLKPDDRRQRVFAEAAVLGSRSGEEGVPTAVPDIIRALALAADPPKKSGTPKRSGSTETLTSQSGRPLVRIDGKDRKGVRVTLLTQAGGTRAEAEDALKLLLDKHWQ
ncbi:MULTISPECIES: ParB/RepB/Spo0J family partition protein [Sphingomonadaceae]|uniref:Replication protein B n=1 Tax=Sphingobium baderi LL03 TaxID=1114964 RepID=T0H0C8_9SPHN|nr:MULTISPECIES: ParB/RepB/Spo0J family partition protein [Sphingomonadaceae]EQB05588.1 replication protein B [Sphingobium baderi LL03]KMS52951.1 replication protein B [Sphingobium baderi LL03]MBG6120877.1 ParB family chromosome partitioning protein [Sphingobium sp. JAI105]MEC6701552.1 ParB/RepB/Spo0J family partition protein [Sphingobium sp. SJ10-10]